MYLSKITNRILHAIFQFTATDSNVNRVPKFDLPRKTNEPIKLCVTSGLIRFESLWERFIMLSENLYSRTKSSGRLRPSQRLAFLILIQLSSVLFFKRLSRKKGGGNSAGCRASFELHTFSLPTLGSNRSRQSRSSESKHFSRSRKHDSVSWNCLRWYLVT